MQLAGIAITTVGAAKPITVTGDPAVEWSPEEHAAGEVKYGGCPPEPAET